MPSYIELNKQASVPASSDSEKLILSVNSTGQVTTTDSTGQTTIVGGGGTGLNIPKPIVYGTDQLVYNFSHYYNQPISEIGNGSGLPGAIENSWDNDVIRLTYQSKDDTFLNYNPRYFLFVYQGSKKLGRQHNGNPNLRANNRKYGKYFSHPASFSGSYVDDEMGGFNPNFTNVSVYGNFSGNNNYNQVFGEGSTPAYTSSFTDFTTEWTLATGSGKPTLLEGFNPLRWYFTRISGSAAYIGREFFPMKVSGSTTNDLPSIITTVATTTSKAYKEYISAKPLGYIQPKVNLYVKFAIVIDDPNNAGRYIIGPMSDTVKIFPKEGYFEDDIDTLETLKYFYAWGWKIV
jgi:hypothetical protein